MTPPSPVDLTTCDREPIHHLGRIQSFAWLIAFTPDWTVARVSANIGDLFHRSPEDVLGEHVSALFDAEVIHLLRSRMTVMVGEDMIERVFSRRLLADQPERRFDCALHLSDRKIILEIEDSRSDSDMDPGSLVRGMMARLKNCADDQAYLAEGAKLVRAVTRFDRVMVYRFGEKGHGQVVAESRAPQVDSFLGLNYPASDIPAQARALYIRNQFRIIADVGATPVEIVPQLDAEGQPLDLSLSISRAVSEIHIEYLKNMGIAASLSISIIVDDKLWGLFACHNYSPLLPPFSSRSMAELFGQLFSLNLEARLRRSRLEQERAARQAGDRMLAGIASDKGMLRDPQFISDCLQAIVPNDGVATLLDGEVASVGRCPPDDIVRKLGKQLNQLDGGRIFAFECLADLWPPASEYVNEAAGAMMVPISRKPRDYVMLFRQEESRHVNWAGNPEKPVTLGVNGPRLTPRGSFDLWKEEVRGCSRPFTADERYIGEMLRSVLAEVVLRITDNASEDMRRANERQEVLIAELNHRVRNILTLIRGVVNQSSAGVSSIEEFTSVLEGRINSLGRAHDQITTDKWNATRFRELITAEADAYCKGETQRVTVSGPPVLLEPEAFTTIALVMHEMLTNSAKHGALSDSGTVQISLSFTETDDLVIGWQETGGPRVSPPSRRGFGSSIINRTIPHNLGGEAEIAYDPTGVTAQFVIPARYVRQADADLPPVQQNPDKAPHAPLPGTMVTSTVLLVEDNLIIALDAEDMLRSIGFMTVKVASSAQQALAAIAASPPGYAMLDINLGNETSIAIAEELRARKIPYIFATGYGDENDLPDEYGSDIVVQKPYDSSALLEAFQQLAARVQG